MSSSATWDQPSPAAAQLIQRVAEQVLEDPGDVFAEIDAAVFAVGPEFASADPVLAAEVTASNRANLVRWTTANVLDPGARVSADLAPEVLDIARDIVRRGLDETNTVAAYRVGQNVAWRHWMRAAFATSSDAAVLAEMLDITARSIAAYVDDTLAAIDAQMEAEREKLVSLTQAQRLETVSLILEGAPITSERASERLGYDLGRRHLALVLWHEGGVPEQGVLERAADELARTAGAPRPFTLPQGGSVLWAWCAVPLEPDAEALRAALAPFPLGVRVAVGSCAAGIAGFKRGHLDAIATQRLLSRMPSERRLAAYSEVAAVALAARDEQPAAEFLADNLGALAGADPVLRQTLRTYLQEQCNASRTAARMYAHRNTILSRTARAEELLPHPLAGHILNVALALEIDHWLG